MRKECLNKANGSVELHFKVSHNDRQTCSFSHRQPLRVLFPRMDFLKIPSAMVLNTSGGILGGDRYRQWITLDSKAKSLITTQAAEKIYGSKILALIKTRIKMHKNSLLEWMPQETILFDNARIKRKTVVVADIESEVLAGEVLIFGRTGKGESIARGEIQDLWVVYVDGEIGLV